MTLNKADMIGALVMAGLSVYFLIRMDQAQEVTEVLKWGFVFLASIIQGASIRGRSK